MNNIEPFLFFSMSNFIFFDYFQTFIFIGYWTTCASNLIELWFQFFEFSSWPFLLVNNGDDIRLNTWFLHKQVTFIVMEFILELSSFFSSRIRMLALCATNIPWATRITLSDVSLLLHLLLPSDNLDILLLMYFSFSSSTDLIIFLPLSAISSLLVFIFWVSSVIPFLQPRLKRTGQIIFPSDKNL